MSNILNIKKDDVIFVPFRVTGSRAGMCAPVEYKMSNKAGEIVLTAKDILDECFIVDNEER